MASSSSSYRSPEAFDVFINHRGPDTKETIATQLYNYLQTENCKVFLDCETLRLGDSISSSIEQAISSSSVQIAIFSPHYAESSWCLNELDLMLQSKALFIPLFCHVKPEHLRYIETGKYDEAFSTFVEKERNLNDLDRWKKALAAAAEFSGHIISSDQISNDELKTILATVRDEVQRSKPLKVAEHPVGLTRLMTDFESDIEPKMQKKMRREEVSIVGIFGMGGRGKTTLAKHFFNSKRGEYKRSCFLFVKELCAEGKSSLLHAKLLQDLFGESCPGSIKTESDWEALLRRRLNSCRSDRFLVVIDDVNEKQQFEFQLFKDTLGSHSLVIVTTRDKGLLISADITICYEVKEMRTHQGRKLFCRHAFGHPRPDKGYKDLVSDFLKVCRGLPLSLKILGSHVRGRNKDYWKLELKKAQKTANSDIKETMKVSYDVLDLYEKQIFIDTACFFIGKERSMALNVWRASGWEDAEHGLEKLKEKCLVEIKVKDLKNVLDMHDHLRDLGRHLADEAMQKKSLARLWQPQQLPKSLELIKDKLKEKNCRWLQSIRLDGSSGLTIKFFAGSSVDCAPKSTDLLWLEIDLEGQCRDTIPSLISMHNLQYLRVVNGHLKRLWDDDLQPSSSSSSHLLSGTDSGAQVPIQLKELLLERISLEEFSNSVGLLTELKKLFLSYEGNEFSDCVILPGKSISETIRKLSKLESLVLKGFPLSDELDLASGGHCLNELTGIDISFLEQIYILKVSEKVCPKLTNLKLLSMGSLGEVDLDSLKSLESLIIKFCSKLERISGSFDQGELIRLNIMGCPELKTLPNLEKLISLEEISLDRCGKLQEISGIETLQGLKSLYISTECAGIWKCIQRMEKIPSEITIAIGKAVDGAESDLNANLFAGVISPQAVREVHRSENGDVEPLLVTPDSLSARVICALIEAHSEADFTTTITGTKPIAAGERIITFVFPRGTDRFNETFDPNWTPFHANVKKECIVSVWKGDEGKILNIFKIIIDQLYKTEEK